MQTNDSTEVHVWHSNKRRYSIASFSTSNPSIILLVYFCSWFFLFHLSISRFYLYPAVPLPLNSWIIEGLLLYQKRKKMQHYSTKHIIPTSFILKNRLSLKQLKQWVVTDNQLHNKMNIQSLTLFYKNRNPSWPTDLTYSYTQYLYTFSTSLYIGWHSTYTVQYTDCPDQWSSLIFKQVLLYTGGNLCSWLSLFPLIKISLYMQAL